MEKKKLPPWCKKAKHRLIDKEVSIEEMAKRLGMTRPYVSSVINGRVYSQPAIKKISHFLNISDDYYAE